MKALARKVAIDPLVTGSLGQNRVPSLHPTVIPLSAMA